MKIRLLKKTKGVALTYAMLIFFSVTAIIANLNLLHLFHAKSHINLDRKDQVILNVNSGLELVMSGAVEPGDEWTTLDLYGEQKDSVQVKLIPWGNYEIALVEGHVKQYRKQRGALVGRSGDLPYTLYLAEMNQALSVTGDTRVEGIVYLPKRGVKRANVEGENYAGTKLIYGGTRKSKRDVPKFDDRGFEELFDFVPNEADSLIWAERVFSEKLEGSFFEPGIEIQSQGHMDLFEADLSGNCKLVVHGDLTIDEDSKLEGVLIYADKVYIDDGFKGTVQIFAEDSVFVGEEVELKYPSAIMCMNDESPYIETAEDCRISGEMATYKKQLGRKDWPKINVGEGSVIQGRLYSNGFVENHGTVVGSVTCRKLFHKGTSGSYENTLVNAKILKNGFSEHFLHGILWEDLGDRQIIQYLK